jgi:hypothetical protein
VTILIYLAAHINTAITAKATSAVGVSNSLSATNQGTKMRIVTLYAWSVPAVFRGNIVDHTWVTTYDNRIDRLLNIREVVGAKEHYWYCWGDFHAAGATPRKPDGFLGSEQAELAYAQCLCAPDLESKPNPPAQGTIFDYGTDGVCHQLANQVLYSTGSSSKKPLRVVNARGYRASQFVFTDYGLQTVAWKRKIKQCRGTPTRRTDMDPSDSQTDDFEAHLRANVQGAGADEKISKVLQLRVGLRNQMITLKRGAPSASMLNKVYSDHLHELAGILGKADFERVFEFAEQEEMNVVDPEIYDQSHS